MPKRKNYIPSYRLHKSSGQARVIIDGQHFYLGKFGSPESRQEYARLIARFSATEDKNPSFNVEPPSLELSVNEVLLQYWEFAQGYYVKDGVASGELANMRDAIWPVRLLFGDTKACEFGPKSLKTVRQYLVADGLSRKVINYRLGRMKRVFKWAVAEELVPAHLYYGLQAVEGLRCGRSNRRHRVPFVTAIARG